MIDRLFGIVANTLSFFYAVVPDYGVAMALLACTAVVATTPLTLKSRASLLAMRSLQPDIRRLQEQYKDDRNKLNEEMMRFYREHEINPLGGCLPLLLQMPLFSILWLVVKGLTARSDDGRFDPKYLDHHTELYRSLAGRHTMPSFGVDLAITPRSALHEGILTTLPHLGLVAAVALLSGLLTLLIARNSKVELTSQQRLINSVLPFTNVFIVFVSPALISIYFIASSSSRIGQQLYIRSLLYRDEHSIGVKAQRVKAQARRMRKLKELARTADPERPDIRNLRLWIDRMVTDYERSLLADGPRARRRRERHRKELLQLRDVCHGVLPGSGKDCLRGLLAIGVVDFGRTIREPPPTASLPRTVVLDLATEALWPVVIAPVLPTNWHRDLAELTSPELARVVFQARVAGATDVLVDRRMFQAKLAKGPVARGVMRLLHDLNDPAAGGPHLAAVVDALSTTSVPLARSPRHMLRWLVAGGGAGIAGNRADALVVSAWHWLEDAIDSEDIVSTGALDDGVEVAVDLLDIDLPSIDIDLGDIDDLLR